MIKKRRNKSVKLSASNTNIVAHNNALGASGTDVVGKIHNSDDHIDGLKGFQAAQFYDRMRRSDTQIKKVFAAINNPIRSAEWSIEAASDEPRDIEAAQLINQIFFKDINWPKFLNEALTAVPHGFSLFEVVHMNREDVEIGSYTGLAQLGFRKQSTITEWCHNSKTGALESVKQEAFGDIAVSADLLAKFLCIFYSEQEGDNIGFPLCRVLFGPYKRKLIATELQYIGIERFAIPTPILKVPKNVVQSDAEYVAAVAVLQNFTSAEDSFITYPDGWDLILHNNVFDPEKLQKVIKAEDEAMSGAILATFLELGIGGNGGAFALGSDLSDFFLSGIEYYANIVRDTINQGLIPSFMQLNFGEENIGMPKLAYSGVSDKAGKELMEIVTGYVQGGVITKDEPLEDHVRKVHKLPPKVEGEMIENGESEDDNTPDDNIPSDDDNPPVDDNIPPSTTLKLADTVGHTHSFQGSKTGPAIERGQKHFHDLLDSKGEIVGRTSTEKEGAGHVHNVGNLLTGKPIATKLAAEPKDNPKALIEKSELIIAKTIRLNLEKISEKYIADILNNYKKLPDNRKLDAIKGVKVGGINKFKKELRGEFTGIARLSDEQVRAEVPDKSDVKLKEAVIDTTFKFNEFSKLPKRIQLLIANQAGLLSEKEALGVSDSIAFQFTSTESSTNDIAVIRKDLNDKAQEVIDSGSRDLAAANAASTMVNETRNTFLLDEEVSKSLSSYTFVNFDPKAEICKTLASTTFAVNDQDLVRHQPPLHHNCKSYVRANLKTSKNQPDITGLPPISDSAKKSITLKDGK